MMAAPRRDQLPAPAESGCVPYHRRYIWRNPLLPQNLRQLTTPDPSNIGVSTCGTWTYSDLMKQPAPSHLWQSHRITAGSHANSNFEAIQVDYAGNGVSVGWRPEPAGGSHRVLAANRECLKENLVHSLNGWTNTQFYDSVMSQTEGPLCGR
jgi:hypothetical protein